MVDVHKCVITLMDPISAPARMVLRWILIITRVLVCTVLHSKCMTLANYIIQILRSVLLILTIVLNCAWSWIEGMSVVALMDMN